MSAIDSLLNSKTFAQFDPSRVPSPCFVVDEWAVEQNLKLLKQVGDASGAKVLLALKAFSMFSLAPLIMKYLRGTCSSGLHEALLAHHEFQGNLTGTDNREVHVFSPGFHPGELTQLLGFADHLVFNSVAQWRRYQPQVLAAQAQGRHIEVGLRVNPLLSQGATPIYDPCAPGSRLGIPAPELLAAWQDADFRRGINGLHFHTLCEQGFEPLAKVLDRIEQQFASQLHELDWLNCGGGHLITAPEYDREGLTERLSELSQRYQLQLYLEPGEAIAIRTGVLVSEVMDLGYNAMDFGILDCSATCHMPDTLEMPYRATVFTPDEVAGESEQKSHTYRLGGQTCLAGDIMGDYSFDRPLEIGQRLMFDDMSHYTMVKTSTFNGIGLPAIAIWNSQTDQLRVVKEFGYEDFRNRLS